MPAVVTFKARVELFPVALCSRPPVRPSLPANLLDHLQIALESKCSGKEMHVCVRAAFVHGNIVVQYCQVLPLLSNPIAFGDVFPLDQATFPCLLVLLSYLFSNNFNFQLHAQGSFSIRKSSLIEKVVPAECLELLLAALRPRLSPAVEGVRQHDQVGLRVLREVSPGLVQLL